MGADGVKKLKDLNPLMPIVYDFVSLGLPLPKSLLTQVLRFKGEIDKKLSDPIFWI
jgi:phage-related holin